MLDARLSLSFRLLTQLAARPRTPDMKTFYPTSPRAHRSAPSVLLSRGVMTGLQLTDQLPFTSVYLHAMVRDEEGQKMSLIALRSTVMPSRSDCS